jgi:hypothetical protein
MLGFRTPDDVFFKLRSIALQSGIRESSSEAGKWETQVSKRKI